jgi:hypothetical protein
MGSVLEINKITFCRLFERAQVTNYSLNEWQGIFYYFLTFLEAKT